MSFLSDIFLSLFVRHLFLNTFFVYHSGKSVMLYCAKGGVEIKGSLYILTYIAILVNVCLILEKRGFM